MNDQKPVIIRSVNISTKKGTIKTPVDSATITTKGVQGDAHSGPWHRQVSLLSLQSLINFKKIAGREIQWGEFAENLTLEGIDLTQAGLLDRFFNDQAELEVTQIGKECHGDACAIFREVGKCAMPKEGIFCRVVRPGNVKPGDRLTYVPKIFRVMVLTLSDRASRGDYEDKSGKLIAGELENFLPQRFNRHTIDHHIITDDTNALKQITKDAREKGMDLLITTGGTGIGSRDITPETLSSLIDKQLPGIMEMIRVKTGVKNPNALLSRSVAGTYGKMLIYALPGSPQAVKEYLEVILPTLKHSYLMLNDLNVH